MEHRWGRRQPINLMVRFFAMSGMTGVGRLLNISSTGAYLATTETLRPNDAGVLASIGTVGDAYDNAMCESFFATLECELLARRRFDSQAEARMAVFRFIEGWYNPARRHSGLGYLSPIAYEEMIQAES